MARDPGTGSPAQAPRKPPKTPFLDAIGHPKITPGARQVIAPPAHDAIAQAQANTVRHQLDPEVVSRQRLLRAHGYGIIVDGVWGPASASAWSRYRASLAPKVQVAPTVDSARKETIALNHNAIQQARERAQANVALLAARRQLAKLHGLAPHSPEINRRLAAVRQAVVAAPHQAPTVTAPGALLVARQLRDSVTLAVHARAKAPEKMSTHELVATTVDPITGKLDVNNPGEVKRVQRWLVSRGHKVSVDGQWSPATNEALVTAFKQYEEEKRQAQVTTLVNRFYKTGLVIPGQPLGPFPSAPAPGELLKLIQGRGNFGAAQVWAEMNRRLEQADPAYTHFVESQLSSIEGELHGSFATPAFIKRTIGTRYIDLTVGAASAMGEQAAGQFADQLGALVTARDATDLSRRLTILKAKTEAEIAAHYKEKMGDKGFWGDVWGGTKTVAGALGMPAHWVSSQGEETYALLRDAVADPAKVFSPATSTEERQQVLAQVKEFQAEHPWIELGLETVFDPMWLVNPVKVVGQGLRLGTMASVQMERLGYALGEGGKVSRLVSPVLMAPEYHRAQFQLLTRAVRELPGTGFDPARELAQKLLGHKQVMAATVRNRVRTLRRHDFNLLGKTDALFGARNPHLSAIRYEIDQSGPVLRSHLDSIVPVVSKTLADEGLGIFNGIDREGDSIIGGQIRARLTSSGAWGVKQNFALEEGHLAYVALRYGSEELAAFLREQRFSGATFDAVRSGRLALSQLSPEQQAKYQKVIEKFGDSLSPVAGTSAAQDAGRSAYRDAFARATQHDVTGGDALIAEQLAWRMQQLQDDIGDVLAQVHTRVEELHAAKVERAAQVPGGSALSQREQLFADVVANPDKYVYHGVPDSDTAMAIEEEGIKYGHVATDWHDTIDYAQGGYVLVFRKSEFDFSKTHGHDLAALVRGAGVDSQKPVAVFRAGDFTEARPNGARSQELGDGPQPPDLPGEASSASRATSVRNFVGSDFSVGSKPASLYDETGKLVNSGEEASQSALRAAAESFSQSFEIENRAFGIAHTADQMVALRDSEIARRVQEVKYRVGRKAGEDILTNEDARVQAIVDDVTAAWEERPGRGYFDTRKTVMASPMHLRHLAEAYRQAGPLVSLDDLPASLRQALASPNVSGPLTPFEAQLDKLSHFLTRSRSLSPWDLALTRGQYDYLVKDIPKDSGEWDAARGFRDALKTHSSNLDLAQDYTLPKELMKEWGVWEALSKAQTKPLQVLYRSMSGFLDVWLLLTLPLRPGFAIRNVIDNTSKMMAAGAIDPRYYFLGASKPGENLGRALSIFDLGIQQMRYVLTLGGRYQGNVVLHYFDQLLNTFFEHNTEIIGKVFSAHQIDVPEAAIKAMQNDSFPARSKYAQKLWHLMAAVPENYAKRALYRATYAKAIRGGASPLAAFDEALSKVEFTLFDYSKVSVLEDNLRVIAPFLQYWRRTANFWVTTAVEKPALPLALGRYEDSRDQAHAGLPEWMRRYTNIQPVTNVLARVPGLEWLMPGLQDGLQTDPINLFSFGVLYRSFKNENPDLPPDKHGWAFIAPFADAVNAWGISFNPLVRKPLEMAGVFNFRAWQSMFPETGVADALSRRFLADRVGAGGFNVEAWAEDEVLKLIGDGPFVQQRIADGFNQWVQLEMSAQAKRGDPISRDAATRKIQNYYLTQTLLSFFGGVWARRRDASDVYLYNIAEELHTDPAAFSRLSAADQRAYRIFSRRKIDHLAFDRYIDTLPTVEAYYRLHGNWDAMQEFKQRHPEVIPYVSQAFKGRPFGDSFIKNAPLLADTEAAFRLFKLADQLQVDHETRKLAESAIVSPELKAFWAGNDTPQQIRDKMAKGEFFRLMTRMNDTYFAIPEKDFEGRSGFLKSNPILAHWWNLNNDRGDDLKAILHTANADLRDHYFHLLDGNDYDGARAFLHRFPFIFEFTKAADRIDAAGNWKSGGKQLSAHARDYLAAKSALDHYFSLAANARSAWLHAGSDLAKAVLAYFARWGHRSGGAGMTAHARDYLAAKAALNIFFSLLKSDKARAYDWLQGDSKEAKQVRDYFDKYASHHGQSQHAVDYLAVKDALDYYFKLKGSDASAAADWLHGNSKDALAVAAYFKKYGHLNKHARNWKDPIHSDDPTINRRLQFWQHYWSLRPDERPLFVNQNAERDGIFIYGTFGQQQRDDELRQYLREAHQHHLTPTAALYLRVKPLLDVYFSLTAPADKDLFLRANPDVQDYLDANQKGPQTGDKQLDTLLETYFKYPRHSDQRASLIKANPKLQDYFDAHSSPADVAVRDVLEVYFAKPVGRERRNYLAEHPEIQAYFDKRRAERTVEQNQTMAFDLADPRLKGLLDDAWFNSAESAQRVQDSLRRGVAENKYGDSLVIGDRSAPKPDNPYIRR